MAGGEQNVKETSYEKVYNWLAFGQTGCPQRKHREKQSYQLGTDTPQVGTGPPGSWQRHLPPRGNEECWLESCLEHHKLVHY